jgi:hypothetical protein
MSRRSSYPQVSPHLTHTPSFVLEGSLPVGSFLFTQDPLKSLGNFFPLHTSLTELSGTPYMRAFDVGVVEPNVGAF